MTKKAKSTKYDIEKRHQLILELIKDHKPKFKTKISVLDVLNDLLDKRGRGTITEATIGRDFQVLGIRKLPGEDHFVYPYEIQKKHEMESLSSDLKNHTNRIFMDDVHFLVIPVKEGFAEYLGKKIMAQFKSLFVGYFPGSDFLLMIANDKIKLDEAKKQLKKLCES